MHTGGFSMEASILSGIHICHHDADFYRVERGFGDSVISICNITGGIFFDQMAVPLWFNNPWVAGVTIGPLFSFLLRKRIMMTEPNGEAVWTLARRLMDSDGLRLPTALELVIAQVAHYRSRREYIFPGKYLETSNESEGRSVFVKSDQFINFGIAEPGTCGKDIGIALVKDI